jgi:putative ABC transport system ATP-binding protein
LILADEPTASIDPLRAESVLELLVSRTRERGITLIVATHAWQLAEKVGLEPISHRLVRTGETARSEFWRNG